jgi:hypothetical protein
MHLSLYVKERGMVEGQRKEIYYEAPDTPHDEAVGTQPIFGV